MRACIRGLQPIARGGSGHIYRAQLRGQWVAIKHFRTDTAFPGMDREMFRRESAILQQLRHPNIVPLLGIASDDDAVFIILPWVSGGDLESALSSANLRLSDFERVSILVHVADALLYCHGGCGGTMAGSLLHRDIKPENILLQVTEDGPGRRIITAQLADFGISKLRHAVEQAGHATATTLAATTQTIVGSIGYIAPEVMQGMVTPALDVYAFGVTILRVATGLGYNDGPQQQQPMHITDRTPVWLRENTTVNCQWTDDALARDIIRIGLACVAPRWQTRVTLADARQQLADAQLRGVENARECLCCLNRLRNTRLTSCGHMALCAECAAVVAEAGFGCLICQAHFTVAHIAPALPSEETYVSPARGAGNQLEGPIAV